MDASSSAFSDATESFSTVAKFLPLLLTSSLTSMKEAPEPPAFVVNAAFSLKMLEAIRLLATQPTLTALATTMLHTGKHRNSYSIQGKIQMAPWTAVDRGKGPATAYFSCY